MEKFRNRTHMLLLYPDNIQHNFAIEQIKKSYDYAMILHNKDVNEDGELKKEHYHVVLRFKDSKWNTALAKELNIEEKFIQEVKKFDNALLYLIHYNDTDKAQYSIDDVSGTIKKRLVEILNKVEKSEGEKVHELIEFINSKDTYISTQEFAKFCTETGKWAEYRRSASVFHRILDEHNFAIDKKRGKKD